MRRRLRVSVWRLMVISNKSLSSWDTSLGNCCPDPGDPKMASMWSCGTPRENLGSKFLCIEYRIRI